MQGSTKGSAVEFRILVQIIKKKNEWSKDVLSGAERSYSAQRCSKEVLFWYQKARADEGDRVNDDKSLYEDVE